MLQLVLALDIDWFWPQHDSEIVVLLDVDLLISYSQECHGLEVNAIKKLSLVILCLLEVLDHSFKHHDLI